MGGEGWRQWISVERLDGWILMINLLACASLSWLEGSSVTNLLADGFEISVKYHKKVRLSASNIG